MARLGGGASFPPFSSSSSPSGGWWGCCSWGLLLLLWAVAETRADTHYATVYWQKAEKTFQVKDILDKNGDAYGYYNDTVQSTGWGILEIKAGYGSQPISNEDLMYAAGYLEGYLTASHMCDHLANLYSQLIKNVLIERKVKDFMRKQDNWTRQQIKKNKNDPFWRHAGYIVAQLDGLYMGTVEWAKRQQKTPLTAFQVYFLNAVGDLLDLIPALFSGSAITHLMTGDPTQYLWNMGHCSALIKVLPGYENILFAHSSWFTYAATLRIYKHWDFRIDDPQTSSGRASFSSYPGFLVSLDDFYILGNGLIMLQTTNSVYNHSLLKQVVPESLFAWQRVRIANMMAHCGKSWAQTFERENSGTYNNQYMILNTNRVKLQESLGEGTLYVVEQIPKLVEYSDQTSILRTGSVIFLYSGSPSGKPNPFQDWVRKMQGYWPSYNVPFHEKIYNLSGYTEYVEKYGLDFSYEMAPRAKIFRRDQGRVTDMESMKRIMRYNNYTKDPYTRHNPCNTICCRGDLNPESPMPAGCYDSKVADLAMATNFAAYAISGPTVEDDLPVFSWTRFNKTKHQGLPDSYNFDFVIMKPVL